MHDMAINDSEFMPNKIVPISTNSYSEKYFEIIFWLYHSANFVNSLLRLKLFFVAHLTAALCFFVQKMIIFLKYA